MAVDSLMPSIHETPYRIDTETDHRFAGWTDGTKKYAEGESYAVDASATLKAVWKNTFYNVPLDCDALDFSSRDDALRTRNAVALPCPWSS